MAASAPLKLDIYPHILPRPYFERMQAIAANDPALAGQLKRWVTVPVLHDLDARMRMMKRFPGYKQVLTLSMPPLEFLAGPEESPALARIANDSMAEIVAQHPDFFPAFVASLPMNNVPAALAEMDRALGTLGAKGVQVFTNVNGRALDEPEFFPVFERVSTRYDLPVWVHPARTARFADYPGEPKSKYEIWWAFGWPYETTAFMARMVFSQVLERLPKLRIITHHLGAMAPYFERRIRYGYDQFGSRTADEDYGALLARMAKHPVEYFRTFLGDTAVNGSASALRCGLDFFGARRVLFGTDCPFDPHGGPLFIRETIRAIDSLGLPRAERDGIYFGNALRILRLRLPAARPAAGRAPARRKARQ
ncbi:MAG: amidohydrolase family protein [Burkholderiales bacterium]